jgi:alpha-beta hydrolase superfamily lysophospholipase
MTPPHPQVVVLHGHDSRPGAMLPVVDALREVSSLAEVDIRLLTGLHRLGPSQGWAWWLDDVSGAVIESANWLAAQLSKPTVVIGFSQGGALAVAGAARGTVNILGVVCIGGFVAQGVDASLAAVPMLVVHGETDETVDTMYAEQLVRSVRKGGGAVELVLHPGGHHLPTDLTGVARWVDRLVAPFADGGVSGY